MDSIIIPSASESRKIRESTTKKLPLVSLQEALQWCIQSLQNPDAGDHLMLTVPTMGRRDYTVLALPRYSVICIPEHQMREVIQLFKDAGYIVNWSEWEDYKEGRITKRISTVHVYLYESEE